MIELAFNPLAEATYLQTVEVWAPALKGGKLAGEAVLHMNRVPRRLVARSGGRAQVARAGTAPRFVLEMGVLSQRVMAMAVAVGVGQGLAGAAGAAASGARGGGGEGKPGFELVGRVIPFVAVYGGGDKERDSSAGAGGAGGAPVVVRSGGEVAGGILVPVELDNLEPNGASGAGKGSSLHSLFMNIGKSIDKSLQLAEGVKTPPEPIRVVVLTRVKDIKAEKTGGTVKSSGKLPGGQGHFNLGSLARSGVREESAPTKSGKFNSTQGANGSKLGIGDWFSIHTDTAQMRLLRNGKISWEQFRNSLQIAESVPNTKTPIASEGTP